MLKSDDNIAFAVAVDIVKRDAFKRLLCVGNALGKQHAVKEHLLGGVTEKRSRSVAYGHEHIHALAVVSYRSVGDHDAARAPVIARSIVIRSPAGRKAQKQCNNEHKKFFHRSTPYDSF